MSIDKYKHLWDETESGWALLHVNVEKNDEEPRYFIVNVDDKSGMIIEDEELRQEVIKKMLDANVNIVSIGNGF